MKIDYLIAKYFADLRWSILSDRLFTQLPGLPMLERDSAGSDKLLAQWQGQDAYQHALIEQLAAQKSTRLGLYYENLWRFYLNYRQGTELLAHNLQVNDENQTVGEFDFIYRDLASNHLVHMETAVKFYLGVAAPAGSNTQVSSRWCQWVGPGLQDRLDIKLLQLRERQLRLQESPAAVSLLLQHNIEPPLMPELQMAGRLFYPASGLPAPSGACANHQRGVWFAVDDYLQMAKGANKPADFVVLLNRNEWFAPLHEQCDLIQTRLITQTDFTKQLQRQYQEKAFTPFQIADVAQGPSGYLEVRRVFIVPNNWLDRARAAMNVPAQSS